MFPKDFIGKVIRATIVGGVGSILGAIVGAVVFGILVALVAAGFGAVLESLSYRSSNEISLVLASLSGFGGALWGAGIGGVAGLLTGILLVVLETASPVKTVYSPSNEPKVGAPGGGRKPRIVTW